MWNPHQTLVLKFGEWFHHEKATKLWHRSLVMDTIHNGKSLVLGNGSKVSKKVWWKNLGMFTILTKIGH
jgi:hypothetical protein